MKAGDQTSVLGYYRIEWQNCVSVNMIYPSKKWKNDFEDNSEISTGLPFNSVVPQNRSLITCFHFTSSLSPLVQASSNEYNPSLFLTYAETANYFHE